MGWYEVVDVRKMGEEGEGRRKGHVMRDQSCLSTLLTLFLPALLRRIVYLLVESVGNRYGYWCSNLVE